MKKILIGLFLVLSFMAFSQNFRNSNWGDSKVQVIAVEGKGFVKQAGSPHFLIGFRSLMGKNHELTYYFEDDKLYQASWKLTTDEYSEFVTLLSSKYGEPKGFGFGWFIWRTEDSKIQLELDNKGKCSLSYFDLDWCIKQAEKQKNLANQDL